MMRGLRLAHSRPVPMFMSGDRMFVPASPEAAASPKNPGALAALRTVAAVAGVALSCVACQPDTSSSGAKPQAEAEAVPPVPAASGQVPEGVTLDLKPQITDAVVSADANGARMAIERTPAAVKLTMPSAGMSRAQLTAVLDPGEYDVHVQTGAVEVQDQAADGLGAFFGPENTRAASIELKPNADQHVRISVPTKRQAFYSLGFGGWGKARGTVEIKTLEISKAK
jgi:hypothetical protein